MDYIPEVKALLAQSTTFRTLTPKISGLMELAGISRDYSDEALLSPDNSGRHSARLGGVVSTVSGFSARSGKEEKGGGEGPDGLAKLNSARGRSMGGV